jgi:hypothetical protein
MELINLFIEALEKWGKEADKDVLDLESLVFNLLYRLGEKDPFESTTSQLRERIKYLIEKEGIYERFLIESLIEQVKKELKHIIENHGQFIIRNENLARKSKENGMDIELPEDTLKKLKNPIFQFKVRRQLERWELIIATTLPLTEIERIENETFLKNR